MRPLYFMVKPPPALTGPIWRSSRTDKTRGPELLHVTLLVIGDLALEPTDFLDRLRQVMKDFQGNAFRLVFDRLVEQQHVLLCGSERMQGAERLQANLAHFLEERGFGSFGTLPKPHMTLRYGRDGRGESRIDPISWEANKLLLIESLVGKRRHLLHGSWDLCCQLHQKASV